MTQILAQALTVIVKCVNYVLIILNCQKNCPHIQYNELKAANYSFLKSLIGSPRECKGLTISGAKQLS